MEEDIFGDIIAEQNMSGPTASSGGERRTSSGRAPAVPATRGRRKPTPQSYRSKPPTLQDINPSSGFKTSDRNNGSSTSVRPGASGRRPQSASAPARSAKVDKAAVKRMEKEAKRRAKANDRSRRKTSASRGNPMVRAFNYVRSRSLIGLVRDFLDFFDSHLYLMAPIVFIIIFIGLSVSRYISSIGALVLIGFGALTNKFDHELSFYFSIGGAFLCFFIPWLF